MTDNKIKLLILLVGILIMAGCDNGKNIKTIKGTIGKEKKENGLVVCVFGTNACMPLDVDESLKTDFNKKKTSVKDLPVGTYIEIELSETKSGKRKVKNVKADINKTVICFTEMSKEDLKKLNNLLANTAGIENNRFYDQSLQMYIEFNNDKISYDELEKSIANAGFHLE